MEWTVILTLFGSFAIMLALSIPISFAIAISTLLTISISLPFDMALMVVTQKMASGLDNFALLAIPFFILAGNIMNRGGIAMRLIALAKVLGAKLPGSLFHCNVLANMMFGSISGSAVASAAAMGGIMSPLQKKEGYDPELSAAVNITSCPTGLLIPPSNTLIVYSLVSGGTSISALFLAGYLPGILMGLGIMLVAGFMAKKRNYPIEKKPACKEVIFKTLDALPSLLLIIIVIGGIIGGIFTATEASAIAVIYTLILAVIIYKEVKITELPSIILDSSITTAIVLLLIGASSGMSWAMANADIPYMIQDALMNISENPIVIMLFITFILLIIGTFMDMTPAVLIFTPIFLPIVMELGIDPVHFGIMMTFNLCIGICTPPVGSALFIGCSVGNVSIDRVLKPLLPFFVTLIITLLMVTFIPDISLILPKLFLNYVPM
ncbi:MULTISPECIES: TRAP transporter large permease [Pasteurellaceae]|uniref:TRAP transporter large permease protein n=1 Tax=Pasteurella atlantica TaxID=2827233 RepID=A0AAW8CNY8_9PAST|nr:TRAP transporter large permease [Pasteurella atlantica]MBR0573086.1 TRAP transporter large permease [Pasteurella atlantica]MDP8039057.1 TRAP transporter large permease [Pasteurella atlantica]MDP8041147.1 TRAP transporter large permease [Pasteurella atlantica]MDP8043240.1 TRAP transporter large permease [Pasteurella atlantica]MDP8045326.1 TRAP transporter large permease [Pasteurella atlantica]